MVTIIKDTVSSPVPVVLEDVAGSRSLADHVKAGPVSRVALQHLARNLATLHQANNPQFSYVTKGVSVAQITGIEITGIEITGNNIGPISTR